MFQNKALVQREEVGKKIMERRKMKWKEGNVESLVEKKQGRAGEKLVFWLGEKKNNCRVFSTGAPKIIILNSRSFHLNQKKWVSWLCVLIIHEGKADSFLSVSGSNDLHLGANGWETKKSLESGELKVRDSLRDRDEVGVEA